MAGSSDNEALEQLPVSGIKPRPKLSIVWLIPLVAIIIAAWIGYKAWSEQGPVILIRFKTAEGLEAGKTKIKYKNVEIGEVKTIRLNHDTGQVEVSAELNNNSKLFLTDKTRFWVVSARINASGVTGLETLLSGAYIGIDPSTKGKKTKVFTALDEPPVITQNIPGKHFILHTKDLKSLERDVPVYYRKFNVGRVEDIKLDADGQGITVKVFIRSPYDRWVNAKTRFWNASGINVTVDANGIKMDSESLVSILVGGIAFDSEKVDDKLPPAANYAEYKLFATREDSLKKVYKYGVDYLIQFSESVRGLSVGAPVEFRGIQLGEVKDVRLAFDPEHGEISIPVTIRFDYGRIGMNLDKASYDTFFKNREQRLDDLIARGLRAQLKTGNLITGQLYIDFDFFEDAKPFKVDWSAKVPVLPSIPGTLGAFEHNINDILKKVSRTLDQIDALSRKLNHTVAPELSATLLQMQRSLTSIEAVLQQQSPLQQDIHGALQEVSRAARSVGNLADYLERHPESLIQGKKEQ